MKKSIFVFCFIALLIFGSSGVRAQRNSADQAALRYLKEVEWPKAYREQDTKLLDRILADEFQSIYADGEWSNKQKETERVRNTKPTYDSFRFEIKRLEIFENGTAIVSGTGHVSGKDKDGEYRMEYQSSNIFIKRGKLWRAIASHVSGVKKIPATASK